MRSRLPALAACSKAVVSTSSSRLNGNKRPLGVAPMAWPERPTRCKKAAMERGEPNWQTRSISPISIPSSSEAVATRHCNFPCLSCCSASRRRSLDMLPWCAITVSVPRRSARCLVTRSASRLVLTKISVVW